MVAACRIKLLWTGHARNDLSECWSFIAAHNLRAADKYVDDVRVAARLLRDQPELGAALPGVPLQGEFRSLVVRNHRIVYRRDLEAVIVSGYGTAARILPDYGNRLKSKRDS